MLFITVTNLDKFHLVGSERDTCENITRELGTSLLGNFKDNNVLKMSHTLQKLTQNVQMAKISWSPVFRR